LLINNAPNTVEIGSCGIILQKGSLVVFIAAKGTGVMLFKYNLLYILQVKF